VKLIIITVAKAYLVRILLFKRMVSNNAQKKHRISAVSFGF